MLDQQAQLLSEVYGVLGVLLAIAGLARELQVGRLIGASVRYGYNVVDVPLPAKSPSAVGALIGLLATYPGNIFSGVLAWRVPFARRSQRNLRPVAIAVLLAPAVEGGSLFGKLRRVGSLRVSAFALGLQVGSTLTCLLAVPFGIFWDGHVGAYVGKSLRSVLGVLKPLSEIREPLFSVLPVGPGSLLFPPIQVPQPISLDALAVSLAPFAQKLLIGYRYVSHCRPTRQWSAALERDCSLAQRCAYNAEPF